MAIRDTDFVNIYQKETYSMKEAHGLIKQTAKRLVSKTGAFCKDDDGEAYGIAPEWCEEIIYDEKEDSDN